MTDRTQRPDFQATSDPGLSGREVPLPGEQRVALELGPMTAAMPGEDVRIFLCTQIAVAPAADGVLRPKWFEGADDEPLLYGVWVSETRAFALRALERRLAAIGLAAAAA